MPMASIDIQMAGRFFHYCAVDGNAESGKEGSNPLFFALC